RYIYEKSVRRTRHSFRNAVQYARRRFPPQLPNGVDTGNVTGNGYELGMILQRMQQDHSRIMPFDFGGNAVLENAQEFLVPKIEGNTGYVRLEPELFVERNIFSSSCASPVRQGYDIVSAGASIDFQVHDLRVMLNVIVAGGVFESVPIRARASA